MRPIHVVLAHHDPVVAQSLGDALRPHFRRLVTITQPLEVEAAIARSRAGFVVADLELLSYEQLRKLIVGFPSTVFTCVHRLADEAMWAEVLSLGAVDCCLANDVR
jgi:hypothetical protein